MSNIGRTWSSFAGDFLVRHLCHQHTQVIDLHYLHMTAEHGGHEGQVGGDVVHAGVGPHEPVAPLAQGFAHCCRRHPLAERSHARSSAR